MKKFLCGCLLSSALLFGISGCGSSAGNGDAQAKDSTTATADSSSSAVTKDWKIGVQLWTFHVAGPFVKALDKADSAGIKYIEAFPGQPLGGEMKDTFGINMSADSR